jgi:3-oxoadipate enol-lactonase
MPTAIAADGTAIAYEAIGPRDGPPLLMLQGLGADRRGWLLQLAALGRRYRCLAVDNRGVGRSGKPDGPYDLEVMAADALAVLDAEGVADAHVMGASMGGVIAQIIGVRHPDRVRSLVLACTGCHHQPWRRELLESWAQAARSGGMGAVTGRALRWLVGPRSRRRLALPAQLLGSRLLGVEPRCFVAQVEAILAASDQVRHELRRIAVPVLVLVGSQDILTPLADAEELVELIPGARLVVLHGAGHALMLEQAGAFNDAVTTFLAAVEGAAPARAAPPVRPAPAVAGPRAAGRGSRGPGVASVSRG